MTACLGGNMKILVLSDTHGEIEKAEEVIRKSNGINLIIHLGDYYRDAQRLSDKFPDIPFEYIHGNSDFMIDGVPAEKLLQLSGKKIFITHGHKYSVKWDYEKLYRKAEETGADLLLFGHTHIPKLISKNNCLILNPGSISDPRGNSKESYAIIEIDDEKISPKLCNA